MDDAQCWMLLEDILFSIRKNEGEGAAWKPIPSNTEIREAVVMMASEAWVRELEEWLYETVLEDINSNVAPTFWSYFEKKSTTEIPAQVFSSACSYLFDSYKNVYMVSLTRLKWLKELFCLVPQSLIKNSVNTEFRPIQNELDFSLNAAASMKTNPLSSTFMDCKDDSVHLNLPAYRRKDVNQDGSYIMQPHRPQLEPQVRSGMEPNSISGTEPNSISGMEPSLRLEMEPTTMLEIHETSDSQKQNEEELFIRSPIGREKQNPNLKTPHLLFAKNSLFNSKSISIHSRQTSTPGILVHSPFGVTPISSVQSQNMKSPTADVFHTDKDTPKLYSNTTKTLKISPVSPQVTSDALDTSIPIQTDTEMQISQSIPESEKLPTPSDIFGPEASFRPTPGACVSGHIPAFESSMGQFPMMFRATVFNKLNPLFLEAVKAFYTEGFTLHCKGPLLNISETDMEAKRLFDSTNEKLNELGVMEFVSGSVVTDIVHKAVEKNIEENCKGNFETSSISKLQNWLDKQVVTWLGQVYAAKSNLSQLASVTAFQERLLHFMFDTYGKQLIDHLFDIVVDYPDSHQGVLDLKHCMKRGDLRKYLITTLRTALENRLLHPGVNTADIITAYVSTIKVLRILEPAGVILEQVCMPVGQYLRSREDTVRCIVASLTDDGSNELVQELVHTKPSSQHENEDEDMNKWEEWTPDPVDADPSHGSKRKREADILTMLVNIYGSKELFVNEYRALLADRILTNPNYNVERELRYLELLKLRFGEAQFHFCEVMLRDVAESRRINTHIQETQEDVPQDFQMNAMILSAQFWPLFREEKYKVPEILQKHLDQYTSAFEHHKQNRTIVWKPHLGLMDIELDLNGEQIELCVSPVQVAIIMKFQESEEWNINSLSEELEMVPSVLRRKMTYWQSQGLVKEVSTDVFKLVDKRTAVTELPIDEEELESAMASAKEQKEEEMQVFWTYIQGMLANLGSLSLERIHSMLKMFAMEEPGSTEISLQELKKFLDAKMKDQILLFNDGAYSVNK